MKNPHGVEPTRYMKREESEYAIKCDPYYGPTFSLNDICIGDNCNKNGGWTCYGNSDSSYECNNSLKQSLFVNTAGPDERNKFSLLDYEVYCIDNYKDYIYGICKHPDIISKCIETDDIESNNTDFGDGRSYNGNQVLAVCCI